MTMSGLKDLTRVTGVAAPADAGVTRLRDMLLRLPWLRFGPCSRPASLYKPWRLLPGCANARPIIPPCLIRRSRSRLAIGH